MKPIIFIPNSLNQLRKFQRITQEFTNEFQYVFINLDRFKNSFTLEVMKKERLNFIPLKSLKSTEVGRVFDTLNPALIVVGNDTEVLSLMFIQEAKRKGIPSLLVQDGTLSLSRTQLNMSPGRLLDSLKVHTIPFLAKRIKDRLFGSSPNVREYGKYCDYIAVWGDFTKKVLITGGIPSDKIVITGSPSIDTGLERKFKKPDILKDFNASQRNRILFFAASDMVGARLWTRKEFIDSINAVCDAVKSVGNVRLIIKQHPFHYGREPDFLDQFTDGKFVFLGNTLNTYDLILSSDALITDVSTSALEALAFSKPVAIINFTGKKTSAPYPEIYIKEGGALFVNTKEILSKFINDFVLNKKPFQVESEALKLFLENQLYLLDGKSSKRIFELIERLTR